MTITITLALFYMAAVAQAAGIDPPAILDVAIEVGEGPFPTGASVPFRITITNRTKRSYPLRMSVWGTPEGLIAIENSHGEAVPRVPPPLGGGPTVPVPPGEVFALPDGASVTFTLDAAELVRLEAPDTYTIRSLAPGTDRASAKVQVVGYVPVKELTLHGGVMIPGGDAPQHIARASASLSLVQETHGGVERRRFLLIDSINTEVIPQTTSRLGSSLPVSDDVEITDAAMDYMGQVWIVIERNDEWSLLLWQINEARFRILVPPTDEEVTLRTARAWPGLEDQVYVVAGTASQLWTTSYVGWALGEP